MTPFELGIMLHYYAHVDDHDAVQRNPPIWNDTRNQFFADGLLELVPAGQVREAVLRITDRGRAFVEALECVPLPKQSWIVEWPTTR